MRDSNREGAEAGGTITKVSGPLVVAEMAVPVGMYEVIYVGSERLIGEVVELAGRLASIQVYEETSGLGPGRPVYPTGHPLMVELGPGLIGTVFDGIQRPLERLRSTEGDFIARGLQAIGLEREKRWRFEPRVEVDQEVGPGDVLGVVQETPVVEHRVLVPAGKSGRIEEVFEGELTLGDAVARIEVNGAIEDLFMLQTWEVRKGRLVEEKLAPKERLVTGQRVIDTFFPLAKGGTACIPGPFGSGKTVVQHQLSKWADADIIVFIGCGERGNEMTDVLTEFPELEDPRTGRPLMERTILVANTSNMPVAAREASVYTGVTMAEYYRDMGYSVALMADSTSRWAEALREISGRLEEMPGEEGYPAYLGSRIAAFYERAGRVVCAGRPHREGTLTLVGAVSPPGGDLSEPVPQNTMRMVKVFWGLDARLAYERHYPAINWLISYSLYIEALEEEGDDGLRTLRQEAMGILEESEELEEVVHLVGTEGLTSLQRLTIYTARSIKEDFLHQHAFDPVDTFCSLDKQRLMLKAILIFHREATSRVREGCSVEECLAISALERIGRAKFVPVERQSELEAIPGDILEELGSLRPIEQVLREGIEGEGGSP
jgi:V/A-type H+-transporting ATPase subunit A